MQVDMKDARSARAPQQQQRDCLDRTDHEWLRRVVLIVDGALRLVGSHPSRGIGSGRIPSFAGALDRACTLVSTIPTDSAH